MGEKLRYQRPLKLITTRVIPKQDDILESIAKSKHVPKQAVMQEAINDYLQRHGYPKIE